MSGGKLPCNLVNLASKQVSEAVEEVVSASESKVSVLDSSCYNIPTASRTRRSREPLIIWALKKQRSNTRAERNREDCMIVRTSEWEEMIGVINDAFEHVKTAVNRLHLISKKDSKIRELAVMAMSKAESVWKNLARQRNMKGCKVRRQVERLSDARDLEMER